MIETVEPMQEFSTKLEQLGLFLQQHLPTETFANAVPVAILVLIVGIAISVLGAKLARVGLTAGFVGLGALGGYKFGLHAGFPPPLCALVGAGMIGVIGHMTFRLWVGAAVAVVLATLALGTFSYEKVLPHVSEFERTQMVALPASANGSSEFAVPTPGEQQAYLRQKPLELATQFWDYATVQDVGMERNAHTIGLAAMVTGLFLGVVAVRWALVISTSLLGTMLVATGVGTLFAKSFDGSYQTFLDHPGVGATVAGVFLLTSLTLQAMLTRKTPDECDAKSDK